MIRTLIIEDELPILENIQATLEKYCPNIEIVAVASNLADARSAIEEQGPELVLSDINLPDGTTFDMLGQLHEINFKIIFITAYEEYAIRAIKYSALDYLVKPIDPKELISAVDKADKSIEVEDSRIKLSALMLNIKDYADKLKKIVLKTSKSIFLVDVQDIIYCNSDGPYTEFFLDDGRKILVSKGIKEYEDLLKDAGFLRVHQSYIVNLNYIDRYERYDGGCLILKKGKEIPVSHRKRDKLLQLLNTISGS
ncbi:MAG: response regulator transcription factor [Bacteroidales bacterium]|nr:response regulator transcription factor [Bacteroidales bacterium]